MDKKLSFSLASKSSTSKGNRNSVKPSQTFANNEGPNNEDNSQRYVTEFDANDKSLNRNHDSSTTKKVIIAPIENEYRPGKRMKNLELPLSAVAAGAGGNLNFEVEEEEAVVANDGAGANMSYGLNVRQSGKEDEKSHGQRKESIDTVMLKKLKEDIDRLPADVVFEDFDEVPVEGYGAALLSGYGWKEGMGIGRSAKKDVKVVEYKKWTGKGGIGAHTDVDANANKKDKQEKKNAGNRPNGVSEEDKRKIPAFPIGKEVRIIRGRDMGLKGMIEEELSDGLLVLKLSRSKEQAKVSPSDVAELGSIEEEKCLQKLEELRIRDSRANTREKESSDKERKSSKRNAEGRRKDDISHVKRDSAKREVERPRASKVSWLRSHIKVRIVSKHYKGGRFYLKKGVVLDVVGPTTCDISLDDNKEIIQGVEQDILETALPRRGGHVIVLSGKHKGAYGSLVNKDGDTEMGVVQDADTQEFLKVGLEQIAEYVGDPSIIGY